MYFLDLGRYSNYSRNVLGEMIRTIRSIYKDILFDSILNHLSRLFKSHYLVLSFITEVSCVRWNYQI